MMNENNFASLAHSCIQFIIVNWNSSQSTLYLVNQILPHLDPSENICIIDNGSDDEQVEKLKIGLPYHRELSDYDTEGEQAAEAFKGVKVLLKCCKHNRGYGAGINTGIEALGEQGARSWYWVLNSDIRFLHPEAILSIRNQLSNLPTTQSIVSPPVIDNKGMVKTGFQELKSGHYTSKSIVFDGYKASGEMSKSDHIWGCSMILGASLVKAIGRFDEQFFLYEEETDYCIRAQKEGFPLYYLFVEPLDHSSREENRGKEKPQHHNGTKRQSKTYVLYFKTRNSFLIYRKHHKGKWLFWPVRFSYIMLVMYRLIRKGYCNLNLISVLFMGLKDGLLGRFGEYRRNQFGL